MKEIDRLMQEKAKLLQSIAETAQRGESQEILAHAVRLEKVEALIGRMEELARDISDLDMPSRKLSSTNDVQDVSTLMKARVQRSPNAMSGREVCRTVRREFLERASADGIHLRHIKGTIFETQSGRRVGIAAATERTPDRWFLGLRLEAFDQAVLLCKHDTGETVEVCLPKEFFDEYGDSMSRSRDQMKFNVVRRESGYTILVPGTDGVSASKFLGDYSVLS